MKTSTSKEPTLRIALLSSSNLDLIGSPLIAKLGDKGLGAAIWNPGFNQYRIAILDPSSRLHREEFDFLILHLDGTDIFAEQLAKPYNHRREEAGEIAAAAIAQLSTLLRIVSERLPACTILINTLPLMPVGSLAGIEYNSDYTIRQLTASYNCRLCDIRRSYPATVIVDLEYLAASVGMSSWYDPRLWCLGRIHYSRNAHETLAAEYANYVAACRGQACKCIVVDLDNTLWGGIVGEDGPAGLQLGNEGIGLAFKNFQQELLSLRSRGVLLAICSKNNPDDALEVIRNHSGMVLEEDHFAAIAIDWSDKAENIREIASKLNIGVDSLVFIDDNPVERARVREALPAVTVPEWPPDPSEYCRALHEVVCQNFLLPRVTEDDLCRADMYRAASRRQALAGSADNYESFLRSLRMSLRVGKVGPGNQERVSQLTQKTNQFNLTTRRYSVAQIAAMGNDPKYRLYWCSLEDRYGDEGIVGVLICRAQCETSWVIDTFLLSCRVIGRTVEKAFLSSVLADLRRQGVETVIGEHVRTAKNAVVANLYETLGFELSCREEGRSEWSLRLDDVPVATPEWIVLNSAVMDAHSKIDTHATARKGS